MWPGAETPQPEAGRERVSLLGARVAGRCPEERLSAIAPETRALTVERDRAGLPVSSH